MLSLDLIPQLEPPSGRLLVERLAMPERRGQIILPDSFRGTTRSAYATVLASAVDELRAGMLLMLAVNVSRGVVFGQGEAERTIWICTPDQVLLIITGDIGQHPERSDVDPLAVITPNVRERGDRVDNKFDEADPRGLR